MECKAEWVKNNNSTSYLYFLRIFSALLVILLHCVSPFYSNIALFGKRSWWILGFLNSISRTAVPIFFMISGYLMLSNPKTLEIKSFYKKRLPHLLIPLLIWNIIYYLYFNYNNLKATDFLNQILNNGTSYHLWFMYSMIAFYILLPFLKRIIDNCTNGELWFFTLVLFFSSTIRPFINTTFHVYVNLFDALANGHIPYFILGYLLGKTEFKFKYRLLIYAGGILGLLICVLGNWYFYQNEGLHLVFNESYRINHTLCAVAVFVFFKNCLWDKFSKTTLVAEKISKLTFGVYFIHVLVLEVLNNFILKSFTPLEAVLYEFILASIISFIIVFIIGKIKPLRKILM